MPKQTSPRKPRGIPTHQFVHVQVLESRVMMSASVPKMHTTLDAIGTHGFSPAFSAYSSPQPGTITPAAMRAYYGIDTIQYNNIPGDGRGMTIAIIDAYDQPNLQSDFNAFNLQYHLPATTIQKFNQSGQTSPLPSPAPLNSGNWGIEVSLDVEWAHVIAPLASIMVVEGNSAGGSDLFTAAQTAAGKSGVAVVSMSFGSNEFAGETGWDSNFSHAGVTFVASTGDSGSPGEYPSYSPNVVAVGGTTFTFDGNNKINGEVSWTGSGGGTSAQEPMPTYQTGFQATGNRTTPDVSMDASPASGVSIYDSYDFTSATPWVSPVGGTSLAAPMFAGVMAIADQGRVQNSLPKLNASNPTQALSMLYNLNASDFHDITGGGGNGSFSPGPGYDQVTGRGTPVGSVLPNHLAGIAPSVPAISDSISGDTITLSEDSNSLYIDWSDGLGSGQFTNTNPAGLKINGTGNTTIQFNYANGNPVPAVLSLNGTFTLNGLQGTNPLAGAKWNINSSTIFITYTPGSDPIATVQQYLQSGYNGGNWNGTPAVGSGSIVSSNAAADSAHLHGIGYVDSADGRGYNAMPNSIELRYTLFGDTALVGTVSFTDFMRMTQHFNSATGGTWDTGDFNYDGAVNSADFNLLQPTYGLTLATTPAPVPAVTTDVTTVTTAASGATDPATTVVTPTATISTTMDSNHRRNARRRASIMTPAATA